MAYTGFISDPNYCRKNEKTTVIEEWTFEKTIKGTALNALWGDVAEYYKCNKNEVLSPGMLVRFGGEYEITKTKPNGREVFGVISSKPGIILNDESKEIGEKVALVGKVPVRIIGKVEKFDEIVLSETLGVGRVKKNDSEKTIAIALEANANENEKLVKCVTKLDF